MPTTPDVAFDQVKVLSGSGVTKMKVTVDDKTVNLVRSEEMLRGIVPRESPASWGDLAGGAGMNSLRAQAVAARSYALSGDTRWGDLHTRLGADALVGPDRDRIDGADV